MKRLVAVGVAFVVVWLVATPVCWTIFDEQAYLTQALRFADVPFPAAPVLDGSPVPGPRMHLDAAGREVPEFALGWPLLLAPLAGLGPTAAFAVTLLLHLLGTAAFVGVLRRLELPDAWALLYLLHPTAVLLSRTAMADVPAMALTAIGLWCWLEPSRRSALLAGLVWGASIHLRWSQGAIVGGLVLAALIRRDRIGPLLLGVAPGVVSALALSLALHGTLLPPRSIGFDPSVLLVNVPWYVVGLLMLYPGLVLTPARPMPLRTEAVAVLLTSLVLFGAFGHRFTGIGPGAFVVGLRFFLPATVLLLPGYIVALRRWRVDVRWAAVGLVLLAVAIQVRHAGIQSAQQARVDAVEAALTDLPVLANNDARELLLEPEVLVVPWFRDQELPPLDGEILLLTSIRSDREGPSQDGRLLFQRARTRWELDEVLTLPPDGPVPGVQLWRGRPR